MLKWPVHRLKELADAVDEIMQEEAEQVRQATDID
jgi:hypothetical protein